MCDSLHLWPQKNCGYGGSCDNSTKLCICEEGFTDVGHLRLIPGQHCNIPVKLYSVLAFINLVLRIGIIIFRFFGLLYTLKRFQEQSKSHRKRLRLALVGLFFDVPCLIYATWLYFFPQSLIGQDLVITSLFAFAEPGQWIIFGLNLDFYIGIANKVIAGKSKEDFQARLEREQRKANLLFFCGGYIIEAVPAFGLYLLGPEYSNFFTIWYHIGLSTGMFMAYNLACNKVLGILVFSINNILKDAIGMPGIESTAAHDRIKSLKSNMEFLQKEVRSILMQSIFVGIVIIFWPLSRSYEPVLLLIDEISIAVIMLITQYVFFNPPKVSKIYAELKVTPSLQALPTYSSKMTSQQQSTMNY